MTYDALMALRGWGREEFDTVTVDFASAVRFALFAERVAPILRSAEETAEMEVPRHGQADTRTIRAVVRAKQAAADALPAIKAVLYPEDDDG